MNEVYCELAEERMKLEVKEESNDTGASKC